MQRDIQYGKPIANINLFFSGITLTLSALVEGKNFNQGGHKIGIGVDLSA